MVNPYLNQSLQNKLYGRKQEVAKLSASLEDIENKFHLIQGCSGIGKSELLKYLKKEGARKGFKTIYVKAQEGENIDSLNEKIFRGLTDENKQEEKNFSAFFEKQNIRTIVFLDDLEKLKNPKGVISSFKKVIGLYNIVFFLSSTIPFQEISDSVPLGALTEYDIREILEKSLEDYDLKMGEECFNSIVNDSSGNPKIIRIMLTVLFETITENEKIISKAHYLSKSKTIIETLENEWFGALYQETTMTERKIMKILASFGQLKISEIAKKTRMTQGPAIALIRRLIRSGQVIKLGRGKYDLFARIYGTYVKLRKV